MSAKSDKINELYESYRNEEKCVVCNQERLGHPKTHEFVPTWEIDPAKQLVVIEKHEGFIGGYIEDIKECDESRNLP